MTDQHNYNTLYFLSHVLEPMLLAVFSDGRKPHFRQPSLHLDNCRIHRSKASENFVAEKSIVQVPHLSYCPDLAPSDFWLFGHMSEIQRSELELVFHWIERVQ
jgi:hypothetical protein